MESLIQYRLVLSDKRRYNSSVRSHLRRRLHEAGLRNRFHNTGDTPRHRVLPNGFSERVRETTAEVVLFLQRRPATEPTD
jgi:hypothetical protein